MYEHINLHKKAYCNFNCDKLTDQGSTSKGYGELRRKVSMKSIQRHEGQASSAIEAKKQRSNLRLYARARKQRDNVDTGLWHLVMKCQYQVLLFVALLGCSVVVQQLTNRQIGLQKFPYLQMNLPVRSSIAVLVLPGKCNTTRWNSRGSQRDQYYSNEIKTSIMHYLRELLSCE